MSRFSGKMSESPKQSGQRNKGIMKAHREQKRAEAEERKEDFGHDVNRIMTEQNVTFEEAHRVACSSRRFARMKDEKLGAT